MNLISSGDPRPRYQQICHALRQQITEGTLKPGDRLPASRALAVDLGLARSTVVTAYDQLVAEGYIEAHQGAGMYVCDISPFGTPSIQPPPPAPQPARPQPLALTPGLPDPKLFPLRAWAQSLSRVARNAPHTLIWQEDTFGNLALRREIARYVGTWRGVKATAGQVLMTSGATEALELALDLLVREGTVALEDPGYQPVRRYCTRRGWTCKNISVPQDGLVLPENPAEVTVLTPSAQFPLGGTLGLSQRQHFLAAVIARDGWVIEDDFDSEFRFFGQPIPAMAALDHGGRCIYVGTFSKTFSHALRLGYLILPPGLVDRFREGLARRGGGGALTAQQALADFMTDGLYDRHIRRARRTYGERYQAVTQALSHWPAAIGRFQRHSAGMQIAFHLAPEFDDQRVARAAYAAGFGVKPLSGFADTADSNGLLIGFCQSAPQEIAGQIDRLGKVILAVRS